MGNPLAVLIVEDSGDDTQLVLRELQRGGYEPKWERVETADAMAAALERQAWDLIVADYAMPHFNAPAALEILHQSGQDIPFILVSGTVGENVAVASMKAGANDYIMKNNLRRLAPAVERELREAENRRDRRRAEEALRESQRLIEQIAQATPAILYLYDLEHKRLVYTNRQLSALLGYEHETIYALQAEALVELVHPDDRARLENLRQRSLTAGDDDVLEAQHRVRHANGDWRWLYRREMVFARAADGRPSQMLGAALDITERQQAEEAIRNLNAELEMRVQQRTAELAEVNARLRELDKVKDEFLAITSHDLRSPLGSIQMAAEMLSEYGDLPAAARTELYVNIAQHARRLIALVSDLLDLAKMESGTLRIDRAPLRLSDVVRKCIESLSLPARTKHITLSLAADPSDPVLAGDEMKLFQVFNNLLVNAIKFTPEGGHVTAAVQANGNGVEVRVTDTGLGIPADELPHLFEKYRQTRTRATGSEKGVGLGLNIVKQLVELHGGRVTVDSELGRGSTFTVVLPLEVPQAEPAMDGQST